MASVGLSEPRVKSLKDAELKEHLQRLRQTDNVTNLWYFLRTYLYFLLVIGGTIAFYEYQATSEISFWWNVPITLLAIILVGAGQHQLTGLAHEGSHHILFKNRLANDLASDWLCMFPMFSTTHHYRLQHLAHHQFVNDPDRDPDISQLQTSGHWLHFPVSRKQFLLTLLKQLWVPRLIRFIRVRAQYNSVGTDRNPYMRKGWKPAKETFLAGALFLLLLVASQTLFLWLQQPLWLAIVPWALWAMVMVFYWRLPADKFHQSRIHPVISLRTMTLMRLTFITVLFQALAWTSWFTGRPAGFYFFLLWLVPIFTSFSFFMILRQIVQHGNGGRGWLTNTRVFLVQRLIRFAVFPMGQDYHLPHHIYASVPHYRLKELHEILMAYPEYREQAVVVEGYFLSKHDHPSVLDVLGPDYTNRAQDLYVDNSVLEDDEVEEKEAILAEAERLKQQVPTS